MNLNSILTGSEDPGRLAEYYTKLFGTPTWTSRSPEEDHRRVDGSVSRS